MSKVIYDYKRPGICYDRNESDGEITKYRKIKLDHTWIDDEDRATGRFSEETIILGEITCGRGGYVTYNFSIPEDVLKKAKHAELYIDRFIFSGRREKAVARIKIGSSELFFVQDTPFSGNPEETYWSYNGGYVAVDAYQKPAEPRLKLQMQKVPEFWTSVIPKLHLRKIPHYILVPSSLIRREIKCRIEVSELQAIIIHYVELKVYG